MLRDLDLRDRYRSDYDSILRGFYAPCFAASVSYKRGVGYFSTGSLALAVDGIHAFVRKGGQMQLVVSPQLSDDDIRAIAEGYEDRDKVVERSLIRSLSAPMPDPERQQLKFVSWLIEQNILDVKVAVTISNRQIGTYHEKLGIFADTEGNQVAFTGSANETVNGIIANFERIDVFRSWKPADAERMPGLVDDFESLWHDRTPGLRIVTFPSAVKEELFRVAPPSYVEATNRPLQSSSSYHFELRKIELKTRQLEAVEAWRGAGCRGILEMATGTGKTLTALACAASVSNLGLLMIAVPSLELVSQWTSNLREFTDFPIALEAAGDSRLWLEKFFRKLVRAKAVDHPDKSAVPCVVGTYSALSQERISRIIADAGGVPRESLIICDEVHNAGASSYSSVLREDFNLRLGLSATPIRKYDEDGNEKILEYFGPTAYKFDIGQAISAGVLSEYDYFIYPIYLSEAEYSEYQALTRKIGAAQADATTLTEELSRLLLIKRAAILKSAEGKMAAIEHVLTDHTLQRALVYVASIEEASAVSRILSRSGIKSARYSSIDQERRRILYDFSRGNLDALVSINCLDEGVDIPNAKIAVLASSDASERQFIQRRGRVLRTSPGKSHATIVDFIVLPPDLDKPVDIFQSEISRVSEFARYSRNPDTVLATLGRLLEPYGFSLSEVMVELGR